MARLQLNYSKLFDAYEAQNKKLVGIFTLQYPIYCIHTNITDVTVDPLDYLDKIIVGLLNSGTNLYVFTIASLLGVSKKTVESRINILMSEDLLVKNSDLYELTQKGKEVFITNSLERVHTRSYDFYIDGLTLEPLQAIFYNNYKSRLVSEKNKSLRTNKGGETVVQDSINPDIVHNPINNEVVISKIKNISSMSRGLYGIPSGLIDITELSYTKMTFQILVVVSYDSNGLKKEVIDGFASESYIEDTDFYSDIRKNVIEFEKNIKKKIDNLIFGIKEARYDNENIRKQDELLISNWPEIDKYGKAHNLVFSENFHEIKSIIKNKIGFDYDFPTNFSNLQKPIEIMVNASMLQNSNDRSLLVKNLLRGSDYIFDPWYTNYNVQLLYFYFTPADDVVRKVIELNYLIDSFGMDNISKEKLLNKVDNCSATLRQLLLLGGNNELLERFDIEQYMYIQ